METLAIVVAAIVAFAAGLWLGYQRKGQDLAQVRKSAQAEAQQIVEKARTEADAIVKRAELAAREIAIKENERLEQEVKRERSQLQERDNRLRLREESLDKREEALDKRSEALEKREREADERERALVRQERQVEKQEAKARELVDKAEAKLLEVAELSRSEARKRVFEAIEQKHRVEIAKRVKEIEDEALAQADRKAKKIIAMAVQRYAGEYVTEKTVSVVNLPNEEMKGRIIGREGRNIRAIEAATGIDLIIDDTPEAVILSGFSPMRREIARIALDQLIADGRIHPSRIEEVVDKVKEEVEKSVLEAGEEATFQLQLNKVHPEILKLVGQLKYRTSYGQNQYTHSLEVGFLAGMMASELQLDPKFAKRAGLLHDIGKVIDHSVEGSHAIIGAEFAKRYGEHPVVVNAIAAHHEEVPMESVYAVLVQAADALSGARPGARREILESYIRRLEDLERISNSFEGVEKSYAVQAGRELRIIVCNDTVSDAEAVVLSRNIARKIESELTYPGQIKVTVIRETRAVEYAR